MANKEMIGNPSEAAPDQIPESPDNHDAIEREARVQGWVDQDRYRGDPNEWVDAETFVKRGREINPILRTNNKRLMAQIDDLKRQAADMRQTMDAFKVYHEDTAKRAYDKALSDLKKEKKDAIAAGDAGQALEIADRIEELKETKPVVRPEPTLPQKPEQDPTLARWAKSNTWFGADKVKTQLALAYGEELHAEQPDLIGEEFLSELEVRLSAEHPSRFSEFGNPRRNGAQMTSGRGAPVNGGRSGGGKTAADLPDDARAAMKKFVAQKLMTEAQYIKEYFAEESE